MQPGVFTSSVAQNPKIQTWRDQGPLWGAPDACLYTLGLNTKWGPMADVHVRRAVQASIDRSKMIDLAYESSTKKLVVPFSSFGGLVPYTTLVSDIIVQNWHIAYPDADTAARDRKEIVLTISPHIQDAADNLKQFLYERALKPWAAAANPSVGRAGGALGGEVSEGSRDESA